MSIEIDESIRNSKPKDAEAITSTFSDEYKNYYGKFVDPAALENFLEEMKLQIQETEDLNSVNQEWSADDCQPELVRTMETSEEDFMGVSAIKFQENLAEIGSTIIQDEYRGSMSKQNEGTVYNQLFDDNMEIAEQLVEMDDNPVETIYTQLLVDESAATQHVAHKNDFAVTGIYDNKFPPAYEGKGRVTIVDMLWAESGIENNLEEVYVPEEAADLVETSIDNINQKREREEIQREIETSGNSHKDRSFSIKPKIVGDPMNFAEIKVIQTDSGDYSWEDLIHQIARAENSLKECEGDEDYWIGLSLDANEEYLSTAAEALEDQGFDYGGFNPGKLELGDEKRDSLEMQLRPSNQKYEKQFIDEAVEYLEEMGLQHENPEKTTDFPDSDILRV